MTKSSGRLILCSIVAVGAVLPLLVPSPVSAAVLHGGYWSTEVPFSTTLVINNPLPHGLTLELMLYSEAGVPLAAHRDEISPLGSVHQELQSIVGTGHTGRLEVRLEGSESWIPAQVQIRRGGFIWVLDLVDARLLPEQPQTLTALLPPLTDLRTDTLHLQLTNVGHVQARGELVLKTPRREHRRLFSVASGRMATIRIPRAWLSENGPMVAQISMLTSARPLLATGFFEAPDFFLPIRWIAHDSDSLGGLHAAFLSGADSDLLLWNSHAVPVEVQVRVVAGNGTVDTETLELAAKSASMVPLADLTPSQSIETGAISITTSEEFPVQGQLLTKGRHLHLAPLKQSPGAQTLGYSFPVTLDQDGGTILDFFNPGSSGIELELDLIFDGEIYETPPFGLAPGTFLSMDLGALRENGLGGERGDKLPSGDLRGQALIHLHPDSSGAFQARGRMPSTRTSSGGSNTGFLESCVICPAGVLGMTIFPNPVVGDVGTQATIPILLTLETGAQAGSFADRAFTANPAIADVIGSPALLSFKSGGTTSVEAEKDACLLYVAEMISPFMAGCTCAFNATLFDTSSVVSVATPRITSITPPRGLIGQEHVVTLRGSGFGSSPQIQVGGGGVTASVISSSASEIRVKLSVRSDAAPGAHSIQVASFQKVSNEVSFFVQVPSKFQFVSAAPLDWRQVLPCQADQSGFAAQVVFQVIDQQGTAINSTQVTPRESVRVQPTVPFFSDFLPFAGNTDPGGRFIDTPIGSCISPPVVDACVIVTQRFDTLVSSSSGLGGSKIFPISTVADRADCGKGIAYQLLEGQTIVASFEMGELPQ